MEGWRLRLSEDRWRPYNLQTEAALHKVLEEMHEQGLPLDAFLVDDPLAAADASKARLAVSAETVHTARSCLQACRDAGALAVLPDLRGPALAAVRRLWDLLLAHIQAGLAAKDKPPLHYTVAEASARFVVRPLSSEAERKGRLMSAACCQIGEVMRKCEEALRELAEDGATPLQTLLATKFPALACYRPGTATTFQPIGDV